MKVELLDHLGISVESKSLLRKILSIRNYEFHPAVDSRYQIDLQDAFVRSKMVFFRAYNGLKRLEALNLVYVPDATKELDQKVTLNYVALVEFTIRSMEALDYQQKLGHTSREELDVLRDQYAKILAARPVV